MSAPPNVAERPASPWRYLLPAALCVALIAVFALTLWKIQAQHLNIEEIRSPLIGRQAPTFELPALKDPQAKVGNQAYRGHPYVVNVWGTWCQGCREEHATLVRIAQQTTVPILGLDWKDDPALATSYLERLGDPYAAVAADLDGRVAIDWGVYGAPETFLVSAEGVVLEKQIGPMTIDVWQRKFLPHLPAAGPRS